MSITTVKVLMQIPSRFRPPCRILAVTCNSLHTRWNTAV